MFEINAGQNYNRIPTEWDGYLPAELFAYIEVLQKSIGFSSHELIPGASLRLPLSLWRDMWVLPDIPQYKTYKTYLIEVKQRIIEGCEFARENLAEDCENQRQFCNQSRRLSTLKPNDEVLI